MEVQPDCDKNIRVDIQLFRLIVLRSKDADDILYLSYQNIVAHHGHQDDQFQDNRV